MKPIYSILFILGILASSCKKAIEVDVPQGNYLNEKVFASEETANAAMRGIYQTMNNVLSSCPFEAVLTGTMGISADELQRSSYTDDQKRFFDNNILPDNGTVKNVWAAFYSYIYQSNQLFESVEKSDALSKDTKDQLMGEARFIRALSYFYLTNIYNDVPLAVISDYPTNALLPISKSDDIYALIVSDLKYAQSKLQNQWTTTGSRFRANKWAATALLARVYLYRKDWVNAEAESSAVIAQRSAYRLVGLDSVFYAVSTETIWALANPGSNLYATEGNSITGSSATNSSYTMTPWLLSQFETGDQRRIKWCREGTGAGVGLVAPFKFKTFSNTQAGAVKSVATPLRLAEQYLIRAEARAMQDNLAGAISDIDVIRKRAGAVSDNSQAFQTLEYSNPGIAQADLINYIYAERMRELFAEFGHRWFDAKRASPNDFSPFFGVRKPAMRNSPTYWPIPATELLVDPNLEQSEGY